MTQPHAICIRQTSPSTANVIFDNRILAWDTSILANTSHRKNEFDIFEQINGYWTTLPQNVQAELFDFYNAAHGILEAGGEIDTLFAQLKPIVKGITDRLDLDKIREWAILHGGLFISHQLTPRNQIAEIRLMGIGSEDMTYYREDYLELVALAIATRALVPIFGDFISVIQNKVGTSYKEHYVCALLENTTLSESEAYKKLQRYVNAIMGLDKIKPGPILAGLSSEDFPDWLLYMIIVRRLTVANLKGDPNNPSSHMVTYIHFYLRQRLMGYEGSFDAGIVRPKDTTGSAQGDESQLSTIEIYKMPTSHTPGCYELMQFYSEDIDWAVDVLCPDINRKTIREAVEANQFLTGPVPLPFAQASIVQNLIGPYVAPNTLDHIRRIPSITLYSVAQAMLWEYGFRDLAIFLTATPRPFDTTALTVTHSVRANIPRNMMDMFRQLYPHLKRTSSRSANAKMEPAPVYTIKMITDAMADREWDINIHDNWQAQRDLTNIPSTRARVWRPGPDIRVQLARLFLMVGMYEHPFHTESIQAFKALNL